MKLFSRFAAALALILAVAVALPAVAATPAGTPHLMLKLKDGLVDIQLEPILAPNHVERIVTRFGFLLLESRGINEISVLKARFDYGARQSDE